MTESSHGALPRVRAWLPDPQYAPRLFLRAAVTWLSLRLALFIGMAFQRLDPSLQPLELLELRPPAALALVVMVVIAVLVDARFKREPVFYANLCMGAPWRVGIPLAVAGTGEVCMALWLRSALG